MSETQLKQGAIATGIQGVLKKAYGHSAQSHGGVIHLFGQHLIKTGILSRESGKLFHDLFTMRLTGDYDDTYGLTKNDVLPYMEPAKQLIQEVSALA